MKTIGYAARGVDSPLAPYGFERRELRANDVAIEILYCGVCHSDLHNARNDWGGATYPMVPGHEIIGQVIAVGPDVTHHRVGDHVAVGCLVDSCQHCDQCHRDHEQFCRDGRTDTYGASDRIDGTMNMGGYSKHLIAREEFVLRVPNGLDISKAAPLLCAGITTYSPLRAYNVGPGSRVGVVGLGGLGHMAVKFAVALGANVTVISRSAGKESDAFALGADAVLISTDESAMTVRADSFDVIIDTIPVAHDLNIYTPLLDVGGSLVLVGQVGPVPEVNTAPMVLGQRHIAGSLIGGIAETQEMLDYCARKNILPEVEMIRMDEINTAFDRMERSDVHYRFVIDMASLDGPQA
jgi:uncharacterized zinc-type alcohol dehydrogenase-like protein